MAGFIKTRRDTSTWATPQNTVSKRLRRLSTLGMDFDGKLFKTSRSLGLYDINYNSTQYGQQSQTQKFEYQGSVYDIFNGYSFTDSTMNKNIPIFDRTYDDKKRIDLRRLAVQDEIEEILDIMTDECICYTDDGLFCEPRYDNKLMDEKREKEVQEEFNKIYTYFSFYDQNMAWGYFRKFLIDGFLAFEILYDVEAGSNDEQKHITGFKELDPLYLVPAFSEETNQKIWIEYPGDPLKQRVLYDSQIIYISYSQFDSACRVSYVERLARSFNLLRIMESTRIIWAVSNASFKTMFTIPVEDTKSRGKQSLSEVMHHYKELVDFNWESGELMCNGKPMMPFNKEYWFPSVDGQSPQVQTLGGDGPDISDTEALRYFKYKLWGASKIPFSRFDNEQGRGQYVLTAESMMREEMKFANYINRIRAIWQEILVKPLYIQLCLNHKELLTDTNFRNSLMMKFTNNNVFTEQRELELFDHKVQTIGNIMQSLVTQDSEGNDEPYWDLDYLIRTFGGFKFEDLENNRKIKEKKALIKEGYKEEDAEKIAFEGADKSKFKKVKKEKKEDEDEGGGGGGGGFQL